MRTILVFAPYRLVQVGGGANVTRPYPIVRSEERSVRFPFDLMSRQRVRPVHMVGRVIVTERILRSARIVFPSLLAITLTTAAHAQGSIDMSGATTLMTTFKTFAMYAGAVICLGSLIFAGVRLMSGRFQDAIPGLFGALFGAGVLGWGAGWISSLTGQSIT
jgi:hypothetical protein